MLTPEPLALSCKYSNFFGTVSVGSLWKARPSKPLRVWPVAFLNTARSRYALLRSVFSGDLS
ncbi:hypothetical protein D3C84_1187050 [compost metagenome]